MKLSISMMLGLAITELRSNDIDYCALGCAANAAGMRKDCEMDFWDSTETSRRDLIAKAWPWLECEESEYGNYGSRIAATFNDQVYEDETMTFEQLVDYVKTVEPDCGECNQFKCTCMPVETVKDNVYAEA